MFLSQQRPGFAALLATLAAVAGALPARDQEPPKVDWDTAAANLLLMLLQQGHIAPEAPTHKDTLRIAVVGDDRFGRAVVSLAAGKVTDKEPKVPLVVVAVAENEVQERAAEWTQVDVVVVASDAAKVQAQVLEGMAGRSGLLVGRRHDFVAAGGHLQLWLSADKKPRFELDHKAARKSGQKISSAVVKASTPVPRDER